MDKRTRRVGWPSNRQWKESGREVTSADSSTASSSSAAASLSATYGGVNGGGGLFSAVWDFLWQWYDTWWGVIESTGNITWESMKSKFRHASWTELLATVKRRKHYEDIPESVGVRLGLFSQDWLRRENDLGSKSSFILSWRDRRSFGEKIFHDGGIIKGSFSHLFEVWHLEKFSFLVFWAFNQSIMSSCCLPGHLSRQQGTVLYCGPCLQKWKIISKQFWQVGVGEKFKIFFSDPSILSAFIFTKIMESMSNSF